MGPRDKPEDDGVCCGADVALILPHDPHPARPRENRHRRRARPDGQGRGGPVRGARRCRGRRPLRAARRRGRRARHDRPGHRRRRRGHRLHHAGGLDGPGRKGRRPRRGGPGHRHHRLLAGPDPPHRRGVTAHRHRAVGQLLPGHQPAAGAGRTGGPVVRRPRLRHRGVRGPPQTQGRRPQRHGPDARRGGRARSRRRPEGRHPARAARPDRRPAGRRDRLLRHARRRHHRRAQRDVRG